MDDSVFEVHYDLERRHWWNLARRDILLDTLRPWSRLGTTVLDIGAGSGAFSQTFAELGCRVFSHDASPQAVQTLKERCGIDASLMKFPDDYADHGKRYDVVLLLDVLEHIVDDRAALETALHVLKPGGILLCTVPSCKAMWSGYDIISHHVRRYERDELKGLVAVPRVRILKLSHFSSILFPALFAIRTLERLFPPAEPSFNPHFLSEPLNNFFYGIFRMEKYLLRRGALPFGSSLLLLLQKEGDSSAEAGVQQAAAQESP